MGIKRRLRTDNYAACCKQDKQPGHVDVPFGHKIEIPARMRGCRRCLALNLPHLRHTTAAAEEGRHQQQHQQQQQQQQHQQGDGNDSNIQIYMAAGHAEIMPSNWYQQPMQQQQQQQHRRQQQEQQRVQQMLQLECSGFVPATSVALQRQFGCNVQSKMLLGVNQMRAAAAAAARGATSRKVAAATATSL